MTRIALNLEYLGTNYHGWQRQNGLVTVQSKVEEALSKVADEKVTVYCAGRTDVGVHALGQIIHFDTNAKRDLRSWIFGGNHNLPSDIRIQWAKEVSADFHARFSAKARYYRYLIYNHPISTALFCNRTGFYPLPKLDEILMQEASVHLIGEHDFSAFRGTGCQSRSAMRNVIKLEVKRDTDPRIITVDIVANAFLQHMVRNIVGALLEVGSKKRPPIWIKEVLEARQRTLAGATAYAEGLYLIAVDYGHDCFR